MTASPPGTTPDTHTIAMQSISSRAAGAVEIDTGAGASTIHLTSSAGGLPFAADTGGNPLTL